MKLGIDVSTYFEELAYGAAYYDGDERIEPLDVFRANGIDCMRIRLWVDPHDEEGRPYLGGTCNLDNFLRLATLAKNKGYAIMLDFHYSDFWADPGKQCVPKSWQHLDLDGLVNKVYEYTKTTLNIIARHGIQLAFIQVGNEITNGMLWPHGKLIKQPDETRTNYDSLIRLLNAGIAACREVTPTSAIILHLEKSYDQVIYDEFFTNMEQAHVDYDIIGYSYYPYWHGTFEQFYANVDFCKKFGKRQMVVEVGYAFTVEDYLAHGHGEAKLVVCEENLESLGFIQEYPITPEGQRAFCENFLRLAKEHGIEAVIWWEPLWIPGDGIRWTTHNALKYIKEEGKSTRNEWANQCLFDYQGRKLPAFDSFVKK